MLKYKKALVAILIMIIGIITFNIFAGEDVDRKVIEDNYIYRVEVGNKVFNDLAVYEKKYKELAEKETDPYKKGVYYSSLVQIYGARNEYENLKDASNKAMVEYSKVKGGEYYKIKELEYLAWSMLTIEKFTDSFNAANDLLGMINTSKRGTLTKEEIREAEGLAYSVFICVYTEFNIMDKADFYYNKLDSLDIEDNYENEYSMTRYFYKQEDYQSAYRHALRYNQINKDIDENFNLDVSDASLLEVGLCQIKIGNLEEGKRNIEKAKILNEKLGDTQSLADAYVGLALYYEAKGNTKETLNNYKKAIDMHMVAKDYYNAKKAAFSLIKYCEENKIQDNDIELYKTYYIVSSKEANSNINSIVSKIVTVNDELNETTLKLMNKQLNILEVVALSGIVVIIILIGVTYKLKQLIKEKQRNEKVLKQLLNYDYLTGVCTRVYGEEQINKQINNKKIAIAILDIDNFKNINDSKGHSFGDDVLRGLGEVLKERISKNDIVYRYGGEEFVIAFIGKDKIEAKEILDNIREELKKCNLKENFKFTFSAGVCNIEDKNLEKTIKKSDDLLYRAKKEGKDRVIIE